MHPDLAALEDDMFPFTSDKLVQDIVPIVTDDDLKAQGVYSEETLTERYRKNIDIVNESRIK